MTGNKDVPHWLSVLNLSNVDTTESRLLLLYSGFHQHDQGEQLLIKVVIQVMLIYVSVHCFAKDALTSKNPGATKTEF